MRHSRTQLILLAATLTLMHLSFPGGPIPLLGWVALAPLGIALHGSTVRQGALISGTFGFFGWLVSSWWLAPAIEVMADTSPVLCFLVIIALAALGSVPYFLFGALASLLSCFGTRPRPVFSAALWSLLVMVTPSVFPGTIAHSQYRYPLLIQVTEIGGVPFLHLLMMISNFSFASAWITRTRSRECAGWFMLPFILILFTVSYGSHAMKEWGQRGQHFVKERIGFIQPNIPVTRNGSALYVSEEDAQNNLKTALALTRKLTHTSNQLAFVAWPEVPISFSPSLVLSDNAEMEAFTAKEPTPLLISAAHFGKDLINGSLPVYNAVELLRGSATPQQLYFKNILIPFGEYLPFESLFTYLGPAELLSNLRRYTPGSEQTLFSIRPGLNVATPVCLEAIYPNYIASLIDQGANMLVNPTDDAYFGHSRGSHTHLALATFRAVEFRVPIVRVTNSGISVAIDHLGQQIPGSRTELFETTGRTVDVLVPPRGRSNYPLSSTVIIIGLIFAVNVVARAHRAYRYRAINKASPAQ